MRRVEVWWFDVDPGRGGRSRKVRSAVILSKDLFNEHLNRLRPVQLTSNTDRCIAAKRLSRWQACRQVAAAPVGVIDS